MPKFVTILMIIAAGFLFATLYRNPAFWDFFRAEPVQPLVLFNEKTPLRVTVVSTEQERERGLSGKEGLGPTEGMLFVFPEDDYYGIWMKDMRFPIDIIWLDANGVIVSIKASARPDTYPEVFKPQKQARYIIETNANFAESFSIKVGDRVDLSQAFR